MPRATVAIATYNRAGLLRQALDGVTRQDLPRDELEVLVIDNNSTDTTAEVVAQFADAPHPPRHVLETRQSLSHVRNRAIAEARGEFVIFADDDILVAPDWVRQLLAPFTTTAAPRIGCVGGEVVPVFPDGHPTWIGDWHSPLAFRADAGPLTPQQNPMGANLAFPRDVLQRFGPFQIPLGRMRGRYFGGDETEYLERLRAAGLEVWFAPAAMVRHQMPASRLTLRNAARHAFDAARSRVIWRNQNGRDFVYLLSRFASNLLKLVAFAWMALLEFVVWRRDGGRRALVRCWRSCGYVYQISRTVCGLT